MECGKGMEGNVAEEEARKDEESVTNKENIPRLAEQLRKYNRDVILKTNCTMLSPVSYRH